MRNSYQHSSARNYFSAGLTIFGLLLFFSIFNPYQGQAAAASDKSPDDIRLARLNFSAILNQIDYTSSVPLVKELGNPSAGFYFRIQNNTDKTIRIQNGSNENFVEIRPGDTETLHAFLTDQNFVVSQESANGSWYLIGHYETNWASHNPRNGTWVRPSRH